MTKYGYARVSTINQDLNVQLDALNDAECVHIYSEKFTGTTTDRPEFDKLVSLVKSGDTITVHKLDRLARNTQEALDVIKSLLDKGIRIEVLNMGQTFKNDPETGRMNSISEFLMTTLLAVAQMERDMIVERTQAGRQYARQHNPNYKDGRKRKLTPDQERQLLDYVEIGHTLKEAASFARISLATTKRVLARQRAERSVTAS
jgi:putative DNA-invertase from lambdoid prophage Rac